MHKQRIIIVSAAGLGLLGCLLPWLTIKVFILDASFNAFDYWAGWLAFGGFISAVSLGVMGDDRNQPIDANNKKFIAAGGGTALVMTLLYIIIHKMDDGGELASIGFGAIISVLAALGLVAIPFVVKDDGNFEMPTSDSIKSDLGEMTEGTPLASESNDSGATEAAATTAAATEAAAESTASSEAADTGASDAGADAGASTEAAAEEE